MSLGAAELWGGGLIGRPHPNLKVKDMDLPERAHAEGTVAKLDPSLAVQDALLRLQRMMTEREQRMREQEQRMQAAVEGLAVQLDDVRRRRETVSRPTPMFASVPWQGPSAYQRKLMAGCVWRGVAPGPHHFSAGAAVASRTMAKDRGGRAVSRELRVPALTSKLELIAAVGRMAACFEGESDGVPPVEQTDLQQFMMVLFEVSPRLETAAQLVAYMEECLSVYFDLRYRHARPSSVLRGLRYDATSMLLAEDHCRCAVCGSTECARWYQTSNGAARRCRKHKYIAVPCVSVAATPSEGDATATL